MRHVNESLDYLVIDSVAKNLFPLGHSVAELLNNPTVNYWPTCNLGRFRGLK